MISTSRASVLFRFLLLCRAATRRAFAAAAGVVAGEDPLYYGALQGLHRIDIRRRLLRGRTPLPLSLSP